MQFIKDFCKLFLIKVIYFKFSTNLIQLIKRLNIKVYYI